MPQFCSIQSCGKFASAHIVSTRMRAHHPLATELLALSHQGAKRDPRRSAQLPLACFTSALLRQRSSETYRCMYGARRLWLCRAAAHQDAVLALLRRERQRACNFRPQGSGRGSMLRRHLHGPSKYPIRSAQPNHTERKQAMARICTAKRRPFSVQNRCGAAHLLGMSRQGVRPKESKRFLQVARLATEFKLQLRQKESTCLSQWKATWQSGALMSHMNGDARPPAVACSPSGRHTPDGRHGSNDGERTRRLPAGDVMSPLARSRQAASPLMMSYASDGVREMSGLCSVEVVGTAGALPPPCKTWMRCMSRRFVPFGILAASLSFTYHLLSNATTSRLPRHAVPAGHHVGPESCY